MTIEARVKSIIAEELGIRDVETIASSDALRDDLGADSMDAVSLTLALEEEFAIEIPDDDAERLITVRNVVDYIAARAGTAAA